MDSESVRDEKVKVLKAIDALDPKDVVRGQFRGYRNEKGVAPNSKTETFAALRLEINSWRWQGVPFYIRAGKFLPVTCTEVFVRSATATGCVLHMLCTAEPRPIPHQPRGGRSPWVRRSWTLKTG